MTRRRGPQTPERLATDDNVRQIIHIAFGAGALLLRWLTWFEATLVVSIAVAFNQLLLHRVGGARLFRPDERGRYRLKSGVVLYPLSILGLLLLIPDRPDIVAGAWGVLAVGDGTASFVGRRAPLIPLPWNPEKSLGGTLAFILFGGAAACGLLWWCGDAIVPPAYWWFPIAAAVIGASVAGFVETIPMDLDDNVTVAGSAGAAMWLVSLASEDLLFSTTEKAAGVLLVAVGANVVAASVGYFARTVTVSGAIVGAVIGTVAYVTTGWQGWVLLLATFGLAALSSRVGLRRKESMRIAEERGGRRSAANAVANTGVAAAAAVMSSISYAHEWALVGFAAALAAGGSDTVASELGKVWGKRTFSPALRRSVAPGTPGGISVIGTSAGVAAALALGCLAAGLEIVPWTALAAIVIGATAGALLESVLAGALEERRILNNDVLNFLNTAAAAYVAIKLIQGA